MSKQVDFGKLNDRERVAFLVKEADRNPEQASEILNAAFRQGVYVTSQLQEPNYGFYQIFKLRDVMSDAGLNDCKRFDSLLCRLRDEEQVQLHARDVTVHTPEENEKDFSMKTDTVWEPSPCPGLQKPSGRPRKAWYEFCHAIPAARS